MTLPVSGEEILTLIPQRPPFVMIDTLFSVDENSAETGFTIPENNVFVHDGFFREPGLIENIAQSAAAMTGFSNYAANEKAAVGFIVAVKNLKINKLPKPGQSIKTQITFVDHVLEYMIIKGIVHDDTNAILAECEMNIFIKN